MSHVIGKESELKASIFNLIIALMVFFSYRIVLNALLAILVASCSILRSNSICHLPFVICYLPFVIVIVTVWRAINICEYASDIQYSNTGWMVSSCRRRLSFVIETFQMVRVGRARLLYLVNKWNYVWFTSNSAQFVGFARVLLFLISAFKWTFTCYCAFISTL